MAVSKKSLLSKNVERADAAKKVNPLDLSADQDLTVALMNLIAIENKTGTAELADMVRDIRQKLMSRIVKQSDWDKQTDLLGATMQYIEDGNRAMDAGKMHDAYLLYNQAYETYAMFWGINMGLVDN